MFGYRSRKSGRDSQLREARDARDTPSRETRDNRESGNANGRSRSSSLYGPGHGHSPSITSTHSSLSGLGGFNNAYMGGIAVNGSSNYSKNPTTPIKPAQRSATDPELLSGGEEKSSAWSALGALRERIRRLNMESEVEGDDSDGDSTTETETEPDAGRPRAAHAEPLFEPTESHKSMGSSDSYESMDSVDSELSSFVPQQVRPQSHTSSFPHYPPYNGVEEQMDNPLTPRPMTAQHTGMSMSSMASIGYDRHLNPQRTFDDHSEDMIDIEMSLGRLRLLDADLYESLYTMYEEMTSLCHLPGSGGLSQGISNNLVALASFCKILEKKLEIFSIKRSNRRSVIGAGGTGGLGSSSSSPLAYSNHSSPFQQQSPYQPQQQQQQQQQSPYQQQPQQQTPQPAYQQYQQQHYQTHPKSAGAGLSTPGRVPRSSSVRSSTPSRGLLSGSDGVAELGTPSYARRLAAHNRRQKSLSMSPQKDF